jgi:hypothetical protein
MRVLICGGWYEGLYGTIVERERDHYIAYGEVAVEIAGVGVVALPESMLWPCR